MQFTSHLEVVKVTFFSNLGDTTCWCGRAKFDYERERHFHEISFRFFHSRDEFMTLELSFNRGAASDVERARKADCFISQH